MKKQWLSIVLALCMVLCLTPTTARAAEDETGTLAITVNVWGLDEGVDAGGKTFTFDIRLGYPNGYYTEKTATITIEPGKTARTVNVPVKAGKYIVEQTSHATIDGYDFKSVAYGSGPTGVLEVFENKSTQVTVNNHYKKSVTNEITELPIKINGYALNAKVGDIKASTEDQMRVTINKLTIKQRNASGGWDELASDATIQADTQYGVEILVNAKPGYICTGLTEDKVTVNGQEVSVFENPSTQPGGDMRVFYEFEVLKVVKTVDHIEITKEPKKTTYNAGEDFDLTGMEVTAVYEDGTTAVLPETGYTIFHGENLQRERTYVTIQYNDGSGSSNIKVDQNITVNPYEGNHQHIYDDSWYSDDTSHWHQCIDQKCPALSDSTKKLARHTFVWKVDKAATGTQTGLKHEECTVCRYKRNENTEIPVLSGHRPATRPDSGAENTVITSAKTGDAGIALYAGLSLLALSGSGWAVGKKRRGEK